MNSNLSIIVGTAAAIGCIHTLVGPDHYVPFIAMSRARRWSLRKTLLITFLCGLGHILGSVVIALGGVALGIALFRLEKIESLRGGIAAWLLMAFGLVYAVWGWRRAQKTKPHEHPHAHADGRFHLHTHVHFDGHSHPHGDRPENITPWVLFTIFVFGPCEALIPLVMYTAARQPLPAVALVSVVFGLATILTMLTLVGAASLGLARLPIGGMQRHAHTLAGLVIFICGGAMIFFGL